MLLARLTDPPRLEPGALRAGRTPLRHGAWGHSGEPQLGVFVASPRGRFVVSVGKTMFEPESGDIMGKHDVERHESRC